MTRVTDRRRFTEFDRARNALRSPARRAEHAAQAAPWVGKPAVKHTLLDWVVVHQLLGGRLPSRRPSAYELVAAQAIIDRSGPGEDRDALYALLPAHWVPRALRFAEQRGVTGEYLARAMYSEWESAQIEGMVA